MMRQPEKLKGWTLQDTLVLVAAVSLVVGLALLSISAALIIPAVLILALGYLRKWY